MKEQNFSQVTPKTINDPSKTKRMNLIFLVVLTIYLYSSISTESFLTDFVYGIPDMIGLFVEMFPPNWAYANSVWPNLIETFQMALIATTFAVILSVPFSLIAAKNINKNKAFYQVTRFFLNIVRTIPDMILAVIFVGLFGLGALPGIIALTIFSFGILVKLISESLESIDHNPLEALEASGAGKMQMIYYAVVPQILPQFVSFSLYVFEINVRASVVLGLVGAGGIGQLLNTQINFFNYQNVMMIILIIFVAVVIIEWISSSIRKGLV